MAWPLARAVGEDADMSAIGGAFEVVVVTALEVYDVLLSYCLAANGIDRPGILLRREAVAPGGWL